jgi:uncharacterized membrane protein YbhN (UPF0104 family)
LPQGLTTSLFWAVLISSVLVIAAVLKPELFKNLAKFVSNLLILKTLKDKFLILSFFMIDCFSLLKGNGRHSLLIAGLTILATFFEGLSWFVILKAFTEVSVLQVWLGSMLNALTFIIPAAPGYVGSAEAAGLAVFSYGLGLDKTLVSAATIVIHALNLVYILGTGIYGLYALKFNMGLVWKKILNK